MTQDQNNIVTMFDTTIAFLDDNNSLWNKTPAFADAVTRVKAAVASVDAASEQQQTPTSGITVDKETARNALEDKIVELADLISALAAKSGDFDLGAQVEVTRSSLDKLTDNALAQTAERVANLATTHMTALADYGVTADDVTALNAARTTFTGIKTAPREATAQRSAQTTSLPPLIKAARSIFRNEIDKLMTRFRKVNTDFYYGYFASRIIVDRGKGQKKTGTTTPAPAPAHS